MRPYLRRKRGRKRFWHGRENTILSSTQINAVDTSVLQLVRTEFSQHLRGSFFPEPPSQSPAGHHFTFGLVWNRTERTAKISYTSDLQSNEMNLCCLKSRNLQQSVQLQQMDMTESGRHAPSSGVPKLQELNSIPAF